MKYKEKLKVKLPRTLDRRIKVTPELRQRVLTMYHTNSLSIRAIAREFEDTISRRTVSYIIKPDQYKKLLKAFKIRRADGRYKPSKKKNAAIKREHRKYKSSVIK